MAKHGENIYKRKDGRHEGRYVTGKTPEGRTRFGYICGRQYARYATACCKRKRNCWDGKGANVSRDVGRWING